MISLLLILFSILWGFLPILWLFEIFLRTLLVLVPVLFFLFESIEFSIIKELVIISSVSMSFPAFKLFFVFCLSGNVESFSVVLVNIIRHLFSFSLTYVNEVNLWCLNGSLFLIILAFKGIEVGLFFIFSRKRDIVKIKFIFKFAKYFVDLFSSLKTVFNDTVNVAIHRYTFLLSENDFLGSVFNHLKHFLSIHLVRVVIVWSIKLSLLHD